MSAEYAILGPVGAFGNHLRWLLLLDEQFTITRRGLFYKIIEPLQDRYIDTKAESWPDFKDIFDQFGLLPQDAQQEALSRLDFFEHKNLAELINSTANDKISIITDHVYCNKRTWHNWLIYEWKYRKAVSDLIYFEHGDKGDEFLGDELLGNTNRIILLSINPELAYKSYLKFNSNLNNTSKHSFLKMLENYHYNMMLQKDNPKVLIIDGTVLFQETLDKTFYQQCQEFFKLSDNYEPAAGIHKLWYNLHKKSEKELIRDLQNIYQEV